MSHLGRSHFDLIQCSRFAGPPGAVASAGTTTFTAANGDMLVVAQAGAVRFDTKAEGGPAGEEPERIFNYVRLVRDA